MRTRARDCDHYCDPPRAPARNLVAYCDSCVPARPCANCGSARQASIFCIITISNFGFAFHLQNRFRSNHFVDNSSTRVVLNKTFDIDFLFQSSFWTRWTTGHPLGVCPCLSVCKCLTWPLNILSVLIMNYQDFVFETENKSIVLLFFRLPLEILFDGRFFNIAVYSNF